MQQDYFGIQLSDSFHLALPLENIGTVLRIERQKIALVPGVALSLLGVINYQGSLLWMLDTNCFFGLSSPGSNYANNYQQEITAVILKKSLQGTQRKIGLIIEKLEGILSLDLTTSMGLSSDLSPKFQSLFRTTVVQKNRSINVLNIDNFFQNIQK
jgi:twitching motility protein PilI